MKSEKYGTFKPIPVAARSNRLSTGIAGSSPAVCCQVEVFATGYSLVYESYRACVT